MCACDRYAITTVRQARSRSEHLLDKLDLLDKKNKQAHTLSGGMQRRLNLAMALVHDPDIVVLDEPEAGLDPQSRIKVREYIKSLARKKTIVLTTHNMDEADRLADRVAIIDHGELLACDTPESLKRRLGKRYRIYRLIFNLVSLVTVIPVIVYEQWLRGPIIFRWQGFLILFQVVLLISALLLFLFMDIQGLPWI